MAKADSTASSGAWRVAGGRMPVAAGGARGARRAGRDPVDSIEQRLAAADEEELLELVRNHLAALDGATMRRLLRHPFLGREAIQLLLEDRQAVGSYEVRRELAGHPHTPEPRAMQLVATLYWRDLSQLSTQTRIRPTVRRAAERRLADRLPGLAVGEKVAIARRCSPALVPRLGQDPNPRVIQALLENPRLTEGVLLQLVSRDSTRPEVLALIARDRRWGVRYRVRVPICRNPNTPVATALAQLPALRKPDLREVADDRRLAAAVRRRADLLLGRLT